MQTIDWLIVAAALAMVVGVAVYTKRYVRSVADFLSGGRCAGRYLLANARGESDAGLANTLAKFEIVMVSGFVLNFWDKISVPVLLLVGISGFVVYRYRETRAMTLAQFLEMRYSRRYRLFMGMLAFVSGVLNYGIFPAVSARFFIYFLGLPLHVNLLGVECSTFLLIMATYLSLTVYLVLVGGQVTLMVVDCVEGILSHAVYIVIVIAVFWMVGWRDIVAVASATPPGKSMLNPFDATAVEDFNLWFVLMALVTSVYTTMALQNKQGFNSAARSPHEARMGGVLGNWRGYARGLMLLMLGLCVTTFLRHGDFADKSAAAKADIAKIDAGSVKSPAKEDVGSQAWMENKTDVPQMQKQMAAAVTLSHMLPAGVKGMFLAIMIMGLLAGDSGHMHSWGVIFVQDVLLPLRKTPLSTRQHMWALRGAVAFVAVFAFGFSIVFAQSQYIALWWALTGGVFTAGAGAAIIGGLYWRRGTTSAAWAGTLTGSSLGLVGIACTSKQLWTPMRDGLRAVGVAMPETFWLNGQQSAFIAAVVAVVVYVVTALLTSRGRLFDLDAMLHRQPGTATVGLSLRDRFRLKHILRFNSDFTFADKLVSGGIFWWAIALLAVNLTVSAWNFYLHRTTGHFWPTWYWSTYWLVTALVLPFAIAVATLVWFGIGGVLDIGKFFHALRTMTRDPGDDGRVVRRECSIALQVPIEPRPLLSADAESIAASCPAALEKG